MTVEELRPRLHRLGLGRYQCHLWRAPDGVLLVDTGEPDTAPQLVAALAELGMTPRDLDVVVLTHFHDDHVGGAAELAALSDAVFVAHAADAPVIRGERPGPEPVFTEQERAMHDRVAAGLRPAAPVRIDREVTDGDALPFGAMAVAVPGHTDGSVAVHLPEDRILFTGDVLAHFGGRVIPGVFNLDADALAVSLERLTELDVDVACLGHGEPVVGGAGQRIVAAARAARGGGPG